MQGAQGRGLVALSPPLRVRRLGTVGYADALGLQERLFTRAGEAWLLLLEHPAVYTLGVRARPEHVLVDPASVGATVERIHRGGDVTYHGPGQLVGYVVVDVPFGPGAVHAHVAAIEQVVLDALGDLGLDGAGRRAGHPGVWVDDRKIAAVGVRITRGRSMHGFALNVDPDLTMFDHIVPCGIHDLGVTSLAAEGRAVTSQVVQDAIAARAAAIFGHGAVDDRAMRWDDVDAAVLQ
ncbi:MAG TPA: lipoyl(octanoyl) transferase LipB [Acidimicrobiia bacterium]|nr:lipoyl(octanoyl) transferase LipB [Acidimicrobiia bacterium]